MKSAPRDIQGHLRALDPSFRVVLIFGRDEGLVREYGHDIGKQIVEDLSDPFNVARPTMAQIKAQPSLLLDEISALSMMGGRRLVRLEAATNDAKTAVATALESEAGDGLLVITAGDLATSSALRKLVEKHKKGLSIACYSDDAGNLATLVRDMLSDAGLTVTQDALHYLVSHLGADRMVTRREMEKLILYMGKEGGQVSLEDAEACVGDNAALMLTHVAEATTGGDLAKLETSLERAYTAKESPIAILRVVENRLMRMHLARGIMEAERCGSRQAIDKLRPPVFFKEKDALSRQLDRWPLGRITQALHILAEAEADCKTTGMPAETITARTCLRLARAAR